MRSYKQYLEEDLECLEDREEVLTACCLGAPPRLEDNLKDCQAKIQIIFIHRSRPQALLSSSQREIQNP